MAGNVGMHERLIIIGARGHGKVVADIAEHLGRYKDIAFLDDDDLEETMGIPVIGNSMDAYKYVDSSDIFVAIGNADVREKMLGQLWEKNAHVPTLVHLQAVIGTNVVLGAGTVVMAGAVVNPEAVIGKGCIINTCASVDHDCVIGNYVHVSVGTHIAGNVRVGANTWIGAGAVVKNNIEICAGCTIGAGAVVVKNLQDTGTYIGVPAKVRTMEKSIQKVCEGGVKCNPLKFNKIIICIMLLSAQSVWDRSVE